MEFVQYNANPKNNRTNDCVVRAISLATNKSWIDVYKELTELGMKKCLMMNDNKNWKAYLKQLGYQQHKMPKKSDNTRYTVEEFADEVAEEDKTYIVSIAKHLTVVKDKKLYDTFDCSKKSVCNYWRIEGR